MYNKESAHAMKKNQRNFHDVRLARESPNAVIVATSDGKIDQAGPGQRPSHVPRALAALLASMELGRRIARRRLANLDDGAQPGTSVIDGAIFALFGLPVAFTFSGAAQRFDHRREPIVAEANDIGAARLRLDLAPPSTQPALRDAFHRYVDSRLAAYREAVDADSFQAALACSLLAGHGMDRRARATGFTWWVLPQS